MPQLLSPWQVLRHAAATQRGSYWQDIWAAARPLRPELLLVPVAAAALLLAGTPQLNHTLLPTGNAASSAAVPLPSPQQQQWRWQWPASAAPAMQAGTPSAPYSPATAAYQQQQEWQQQQQSSKGADRPFELDTQTVTALATCMVVAALANSAGIGGGAFIVPLMSLGLGFGIKDATALSQAVIAVRKMLECGAAWCV